MIKKNKSISVTPIETSIFRQGDSIADFLKSRLSSEMLENSVLTITSKVVSLAENRVVKKDQISKQALVQQEAGHYLTEGLHGVQLTITHGLLIPSAGIDESNSESGGYILYPKDPFASAQVLHKLLAEHFKLQNFGVILTDSRSNPLRQGVTGVALSHWGFLGTESLVGKEDIYQKPLKFTHVNVADALAAMGVFAMGEGAEVTPLALISGATVTFTKTTTKQEVQVLPENDLYFPLLKPWLQND